jgi:UrcA family protein
MILLIAAVAASLPLTSTSVLPTDGAREVSYRDLDLSTDEGAAALHSRVRRAIDVMCADPSGPSPAVVIDRECREQAWAYVRPQLDATIASAQRDGIKLASADPR